MKLRMMFPGYECRLAAGDFRDFVMCIQRWLSRDIDDGQFMWAFASLDRIYLRITDTAANVTVPPDCPHRLMEIGFLHESAFEREHVFPSDLITGAWSLSETDARNFMDSVVANARHGCQEMYFKINQDGVWKCGAMPSFSES